jgi:hypothetical protein
LKEKKIKGQKKKTMKKKSLGVGLALGGPTRLGLKNT